MPREGKDNSINSRMTNSELIREKKKSSGIREKKICAHELWIKYKTCIRCFLFFCIRICFSFFWSFIFRILEEVEKFTIRHMKEVKLKLRIGLHTGTGCSSKSVDNWYGKKYIKNMKKWEINKCLETLSLLHLKGIILHGKLYLKKNKNSRNHVISQSFCYFSFVNSNQLSINVNQHVIITNYIISHLFCALVLKKYVAEILIKI